MVFFQTMTPARTLAAEEVLICMSMPICFPFATGQGAAGDTAVPDSGEPVPVHG